MKTTVFALLLALSGMVAAESGGVYVVVQSGAFKNPKFAERQAAEVSLLGVPSSVVAVQDDEGGTVSVVQSQPMLQKDAEAVLEHLEQNKIHALMLSLD